ncbi:collagen alpha-1(I) chain-like [Cricetulus griseus]|uniref:Collagen alpha-1(I) chain-like n=1 Tax=Cricetulus griseus TaxID=10029 RepID=A0A9J7HF80_CRIGR|nr:collagen alpha-1(I) chain-like [Cricetulus griseus]
MRRGPGAPRPVGLCTRPSPRGRLPRSVRARMRLSPLGSPEPRRAARSCATESQAPEETPLLRAGVCSFCSRRGKRGCPGVPSPPHAGREAGPGGGCGRPQRFGRLWAPWDAALSSCGSHRPDEGLGLLKSKELN